MNKKFISGLIVTALIVSSFIGCSLEKDKTSSVDSQAKQTQKVSNSKKDAIEAELMKQLKPLPKTKKGEKVGVLIISLTNPFWSNMKTQYENAAKELGIKVEVMAAPNEGDTKSQLETLDAMAVKDYDAIVVSPIEGTNLIPGVVKANKNNIPVVNLGPGIKKGALKDAGGHLDGIITVDFVNQGKMVAEDMVKHIDKKGKVAIIEGLPGAAQSEGRSKGAQEVFKKTKGIEIVSVQPGKWDRNTAYNIATNIIQANPDLKGIFACNDVMALAASDALEAAGKRDKVTIYGVDFTKEGKEGIKNGKLDGSITYSPAVYAKAALMLAIKSSQGQKDLKPVYSPLVIVNKENIDEFDKWE